MSVSSGHPSIESSMKARVCVVDDGVYKVAPDFHKNEFKIFVWNEI